MLAPSNRPSPREPALRRTQTCGTPGENASARSVAASIASALCTVPPTAPCGSTADRWVSVYAERHRGTAPPLPRHARASERIRTAPGDQPRPGAQRSRARRHAAHAARLTANLKQGSDRRPEQLRDPVWQARRACVPGRAGRGLSGGRHRRWGSPRTRPTTSAMLPANQEHRSRRAASIALHPPTAAKRLALGIS